MHPCSKTRPRCHQRKVLRLPGIRQLACLDQVPYNLQNWRLGTTYIMTKASLVTSLR